MANEKKLNVTINDGDEFFAHEVSVSYNPTLFNIDFRRISSRVDMRSNDANVLVLRHNVVILEPYVIKKLIEVLQKAVDKYESEFNKIETPDAIKKLESKLKVELEKQNNHNVVDYAPNYFG